MSVDIQVGDRVKLLGLPDWLIHDLPESEQIEMRGFIGQCTVVTEIDPYAYVWIGFGSAIEIGAASYWSGHSFGVTEEFIERVNIDQNTEHT